MRRNRKTGLVRNESAILLVAGDLLTAGTPSFHGYQLTTELREHPGTKMSYSTVYRCLDRLEDRGLLTASWETNDLQGPPRRVYQLSPDGVAKIAELQDLVATEQFSWLMP